MGQGVRLLSADPAGEAVHGQWCDLRVEERFWIGSPLCTTTGIAVDGLKEAKDAVSELPVSGLRCVVDLANNVFGHGCHPAQCSFRAPCSSGASLMKVIAWFVNFRW